MASDGWQEGDLSESLVSSATEAFPGYCCTEVAFVGGQAFRSDCSLAVWPGASLYHQLANHATLPILGVFTCQVQITSCL